MPPVTESPVLLIVPPGAMEASYPLHLASLAAALRQLGWSPVGVDMRMAPLPPMLTARASAAIVETSIRGVASALSVAQTLRRQGIPRLIAVGAAAAVAPWLFVTEYPRHSSRPRLFDAAVTGDAEKVVPALLGAPPGFPVAGAFVVDSHGVVRSLPGGFLTAQELPTPERDTFANASYALHPVRRTAAGIAVEWSRGCPHACPYCPTPAQYPGHRARSVEAVIAEMVTLATGASSPRFLVEDEQPLGDIRFFARVLQEVRTRLPDAVLEFPNGLRPDLLDRELLEMMAASGVRRIALGIESGSEEGRARLGRALSDAQLHCLIGVARRLGMTVTGYFMIGLPDEPLTSAIATLQAATRLPLHYAHVSVYWPWNPPLVVPSARQRLMALPRAISYVAAYSWPPRLRDLIATRDLSSETALAATIRLWEWLRAGARGGGGW